MNKRGSKLTGMIVILIGLIIAVGSFYYRCLSGSNFLQIAQCFSSPATWALVIIGGVIGTIGGIIFTN